ncbi:hypothetical protein AFR_34440 [Actinoplanes friuliensis DSM 7358]|uniref:ABC3 transporter permease C-terminal domain-containing protein n=2 Tax=Actinoplanes friuliensis TaxID=196914 RepID=U5WB34_9ACTN|nr:hypothetical protein AFR_34440 [Actinoplanes friuliensis DSM 7358]
MRRLRAYAGHWALLLILTLVAGLLAAGLPRLANEFTDRGLQGDVTRLPHTVRDVSYRAAPELKTQPSTALAQLPTVESRLPAPLRALVEDRWASGQVGPLGLSATGPGMFAQACTPQPQIRTQTGTEQAVRLAEGRLPRSGQMVETVLSRDAATTAQLRVGDTLTVAGATGTVLVRVVGVFDPVDAAAPFWDDQRLESVTCPRPDEGMTFRLTLLTDAAGLKLATRTAPAAYAWRFRINAQRLRASDIPELTAALVAARRTPPLPGTLLETGLDGTLTTFDQKLRGARATLAIVQSGLLSTLAGLVVLAALLLVDRRRQEFALLRARGSTATRVGLRTLAETLLVAPAGVLGGWAIALLLPGRPDAGENVLLLALLFFATLTGPVLAARARSAPGRARLRPSARRITAEVFLVVVAVLGVVLVRRRGLSGTVDPYLVLVPVLLAAGAALVAVRLLPWPLRQIGRLAARARGALPFLSLARAGRGAAVTIGPLAVLVVAIATGVFTGAVSETVSGARDQATDQEIAADAEVTGFGFAPSTTGLLTAVPGVTAAAPMLIGSGVPLTAASGRRTQAQLLIVDGAAADEVMSRSGVGVRLPSALSATASGGPVPVVVSPDVAAEVGAGGVIVVQGQRYDFRVAAVQSAMPGLGVSVRRFVAVPWRALPVPASQPLVPTRYLVAAGSFDKAALLRAADTGQREYYLGLLQRTINADATAVSDAQLPRRATATTWQEYRRSLEDSGANAVLSFTFTAGAAGAAALALLAVGLTVLADAPGRGRTLSRLRTMGLSLRQGRRLLIYELVPLIGVALVAGGLVGVFLPRLIGPALGLDAFTAGLPAGTRVGPWLPAAALLLVAAALATAVVVENLINRRMRLGDVLRLGEEN